MGLYDEIHQLEVNIFNSLDAAYKAIQVRKRDDAKAYIATVEVLNEEYKQLTHIDFVSEKTRLDLYERLWRHSNA